jgi:VanZ family protein
MTYLKKLEISLAKAFSGLPNISESGRESVAKVLPVLAVIFGVFQLAASYWVFKLARVAEQVDNLLRSYSVLNGGNVGLSSTDKTLIYLGAIVLLADAVILLMAYSGLAARKKRGWDLLFLAGLVNVAYSVVSLFISGRGFGSFLFGMIGSAIGFWLLFQVRSRFGGKRSESKSSGDVVEAPKVTKKRTTKK